MFGGIKEMLMAREIGKVRRAIENGESQRSVAKKYRMSRNTVKKIVRSGLTKFKYTERETIYPVIGPYIEQLQEILLFRYF